MGQTMKPRGRKIDFRKFGISYIAGQKVCHLHVGGRINTQCGLYRLSLKVTSNGGPPVCKNCRKTIKVIRKCGKRIAVFRSADTVRTFVEKRY